MVFMLEKGDKPINYRSIRLLNTTLKLASKIRSKLVRPETPITEEEND